MKNKRGVSQVIAMILIILIVIVAVSIIWFAIRPTIDISDDISLERFTVNMEILGESVSIDDNNVFFKVKRNPGKGDITNLKVILEDINGNEKLFDIEDFIIQELETRDVIINNYRSQGLSDISKISIAPVFSSNGREVIGNVADVYIVQGLGGDGNGGGDPLSACDDPDNDQFYLYSNDTEIDVNIFDSNGKQTFTVTRIGDGKVLRQNFDNEIFFKDLSGGVLNIS